MVSVGHMDRTPATNLEETRHSLKAADEAKVQAILERRENDDAAGNKAAPVGTDSVCRRRRHDVGKVYWRARERVICLTESQPVQFVRRRGLYIVVMGVPRLQSMAWLTVADPPRKDAVTQSFNTPWGSGVKN
jgi:hypothetical protein